VTRTPLSRSIGQLKGQGHQADTYRGVNVSGSCSGEWERIERGNILLRCRLQARSARRREALLRPQRDLEHVKDIKLVGGVQRRATKLVESVIDDSKVRHTGFNEIG